MGNVNEDNDFEESPVAPKRRKRSKVTDGLDSDQEEAVDPDYVEGGSAKKSRVVSSKPKVRNAFMKASKTESNTLMDFGIARQVVGGTRSATKRAYARLVDPDVYENEKISEQIFTCDSAVLQKTLKKKTADLVFARGKSNIGEEDEGGAGIEEKRLKYHRMRRPGDFEKKQPHCSNDVPNHIVQFRMYLIKHGLGETDDDNSDIQTPVRPMRRLPSLDAASPSPEPVRKVQRRSTSESKKPERSSVLVIDDSDEEDVIDTTPAPTPSAQFTPGTVTGRRTRAISENNDVEITGTRRKRTRVSETQECGFCHKAIDSLKYESHIKSCLSSKETCPMCSKAVHRDEYQAHVTSCVDEQEEEEEREKARGGRLRRDNPFPHQDHTPDKNISINTHDFYGRR